MSLTFDQARDEVFALLNTAWTTTGYTMIWPDTPGAKPITDTPWARTTMRHTTGEQSSLANHEGKRRWRRDGVLVVQIYTPAGEGLAQSYNLAKIVADAFEGKDTPGGVWFRNTRLNEVGPDGDWYQLNVLTDFVYDEVK